MENESNTVRTTNPLGTVAIGIKAPIIQKGDNPITFVLDAIKASNVQLREKDIIGITESLVARASGLYATVDDIANDIRSKFLETSNGKHKTGCVILHKPIYSRNRFATIFRGIARAAEEIIIVMPQMDEVGNLRQDHPFTRLNYAGLYEEIAKEEKVAYVTIVEDISEAALDAINGASLEGTTTDHNAPAVINIDCGLHNFGEYIDEVGGLIEGSWYHLANILRDRCDFGVLGSNAAGPDRIKLFPNKVLSQGIVEELQEMILREFNVPVECLIYGDGCFHSPEINGMKGTSINEFADPVTSPGFTKGLDSYPDELKIKALADTYYGEDVSREAIEEKIKGLINGRKEGVDVVEPSDISMGTTPRRYVDSVASLCDLVTGSGEKGTPIVVIQNYFGTYAD